MAVATLGSATDDAKRQARQAARSPWVERLGTWGFASKGVLYLVIAAIAGSVGFASDGEQASQTGAISQLSEQSWGTILLIFLAVGLAGYALLRLLHLFTNPSGEDGGKGIVKRLSYLARFLLYGALTVYTAAELTGGDNGGGDGRSGQLTRQLLDLPAGRLIVAAIAVVMLGVAGFQLKNAWTSDFMSQITKASGSTRRWIEIIGRIGHGARGVVFGTIGVLFVRAAMQADSTEAGGVDKALQTIASSTFGPTLLTLVALGLAAFGLFSLAVARWGTARTAG